MKRTDQFGREIKSPMNKIRDNLYLGNRISAEIENLKDSSITAVLNVAIELDDPDYHGKYKSAKVGLTDDANNSPELIKEAVDALKKLIDEGETVLIHCKAGKSRSPHILAIYLAEKEDRSYDDVFQELRKLRPQILPISLMDEQKVLIMKRVFKMR